MNNMQKSPLQEAVERAHALGRRAVIPFITAGFPDKESFWTHLERIDGAGADIIEIGVPFSDPVADGPLIEQASRDALARGVSLKWILDGLKARKGRFFAKLALMGYVNPFLPVRAGTACPGCGGSRSQRLHRSGHAAGRIRHLQGCL